MLELATLSDRESVNAMARQVHAMHISWRPDIYEMPEELYPEDRFQQAIQDRQLYVAKMGGIAAGYVLVKIRDYNWPGVVRRKIMVVDEICVEEAFRRQGIGTEMMLEVQALARALGCTDMQLGVYPQNADAVAFYQKCGFQIQSVTMQRKVMTP